MVKDPPSNSGVTGLVPDGGTKIPHTPGQLSPPTIREKSMCLNKNPVETKKKREKKKVTTPNAAEHAENLDHKHRY